MQTRTWQEQNLSAVLPSPLGRFAVVLFGGVVQDGRRERSPNACGSTACERSEKIYAAPLCARLAVGSTAAERYAIKTVKEKRDGKKVKE